MGWLKFFKSLCSAMKQERFNGLVTITLKNATLKKIYYEDIIEKII